VPAGYGLLLLVMLLVWEGAAGLQAPPLPPPGALSSTQPIQLHAALLLC
jgi:hypothetical protein